MAFTYIVRCADGTLYTGYAEDVAARVAVHNSGKGAKYTGSRRPVELVFARELPDKSHALKAERAIKSLPRERKLALIRSPELFDQLFADLLTAETEA